MWTVNLICRLTFCDHTGFLAYEPERSSIVKGFLSIDGI